MEICKVDGCNKLANRIQAGLCEAHYMRLRRKGSTDKFIPPQKRMHTGGYILMHIPNHPLTKRHTGPYEYEHRIVFYDKHGDGPFHCHWCNKIISWDDMHVDHLNNQPDDNRLENLVASCPVCNQHRGREKMIQSMREKYGQWIIYKGQRKLRQQWAKELKISSISLQWRLTHGWSLDRALTEPRGKFGPLGYANR